MTPGLPAERGGTALLQEKTDLEKEMVQTNYWRTVMEVSQGGAIMCLVSQGIVSLLGYRTMTALFLSMAVAAGLINRIASRQFMVHWNLCFNSKKGENIDE